MFISLAVGAACWRFYGAEIRQKFEKFRLTAPLKITPSPISAPDAANAHALLGLIKNIQDAQKRNIDQVEQILQSQASQQAAISSTAEALASVNANIDMLQRRAAVSDATEEKEISPTRALPPAVLGKNTGSQMARRTKQVPHSKRVDDRRADRRQLLGTQVNDEPNRRPR